ncbi:MAG: hypothetical protein HOH43_26010 [Candidatus Latescibacteria bacterium]|nr:hypothetical protein [Candidatus Latescibacterota bacterium]
MAPTTSFLPGTDPLVDQADFAAEMVSGIDRYLDRLLQESGLVRAKRWHHDGKTINDYLLSIEPNRKRFSSLLGLKKSEESVVVREINQYTQNADGPLEICGTGDGFTIHAIEWSVRAGVTGEGLLLQPNRDPIANIIALPDCDWTPEMLVGLTSGIPEQAQFARRLAEAGCRIVVPMLIDRSNTWSGIPGVAKVNQPHREFVYRAAYEVGRYPISYEIEKILSIVDWLTGSEGETAHDPPLGAIGYGEGGLIAMYTAAVDTRIKATVVSGYFEPRESMFAEPIYRNVFGLLNEFGDAEIASLIAPRTLVVEASAHPEVTGPLEPQGERRGGAAPGRISTPSLNRVVRELSRARQLTQGLAEWSDLVAVEEGHGLPGSASALTLLLTALCGKGSELCPDGGESPRALNLPDAVIRQKRQFCQIMDDTQHLMREAEYVRESFWGKADRSTEESWRTSVEWYRSYFHDEIIGRLPMASESVNAKTRLAYSTESFTGYEVSLDVFEDVLAYGILLIPNGIQDGERRPVVVCQHGLEGRPQDVADPDVDHDAYHRFACRLAERGYITYAPQNPYIGETRFRELLRKAHPLKQTLYGFIVRQHEQTLQWLSTLPNVDPTRIAFYGLSYGGKTAMRIPALVMGYCLSICSADYNEWIWKNMSDRSPFSYLLSGEYDMPEYNLANTFNYAEMSWLISPRPFMVERGHDDGVAPDEWVAYEYARTYRHYAKLGWKDRTELEIFDGPHTINGKGTFAFLDRFLPATTDNTPC